MRPHIKRFSTPSSRGYAGLGEIFDQSTYWGNVRALTLACVATYFMWHFEEIFAWYRELRGMPYEIDLAKQNWARLWTAIIGGVGILTPIVAMILIPINRRRARKSAEGQWFDHPDLTREELDAEASEPSPEPERNVRPETPEPDGYWKEESMPTHLIVESAVPKSAAGNLRLESHDGRPVLVAPSGKAPDHQ